MHTIVRCTVVRSEAAGPQVIQAVARNIAAVVEAAAAARGEVRIPRSRRREEVVREGRGARLHDTLSTRRWTMAKRLSRRDITRAIPVLMMGTALGGLSRVLAACSSDSSGSLRNPTNNNPPRNATPTDDDE